MKNYISKALKKLDKLSHEQIAHLVNQLLDQNSQYLMILNSYQDALLACGRDFIPWYTNAAASRLFRLPKIKSNSTIWEQVEDVGFSAFLKENLLKNSGEKKRLGLVIDEHVLWVRIFPLVGEGKIQGWLIWGTDVTQEHRQNSLRRGNENLAQLANMTAILAHEIRNPLTAISIHLQLIQTYRTETGHEKDIDDCLRIISEEVHQLNAVTGQFLSTPRPVEVTAKSHDICDIIMRTAKFLEPEIEDHAIKLILDLPETPINLAVDEALIRLALVNLVRNAMAAIPHPLGMIVIQMQEKGNQLQIFVCDNGVGVSIQDQEKIFGPYYTTKENGFGLGLTVAYKVAREHSGSIAVISPSLVLKKKKYRNKEVPTAEYPGADFVISLPKITDKKLLISFAD
ncbi:MAG: sensor histidine kinase [Spirochaetia bacterium]